MSNYGVLWEHTGLVFKCINIDTDEVIAIDFGEGVFADLTTKNVWVNREFLRDDDARKITQVIGYEGALRTPVEKLNAILLK